VYSLTQNQYFKNQWSYASKNVSIACAISDAVSVDTQTESAGCIGVASLSVSFNYLTFLTTYYDAYPSARTITESELRAASGETKTTLILERYCRKGVLAVDFSCGALQANTTIGRSIVSVNDPSVYSIGGNELSTMPTTISSYKYTNLGSAQLPISASVPAIGHACSSYMSCGGSGTTGNQQFSLTTSGPSATTAATLTITNVVAVQPDGSSVHVFSL
jgi:hypothetical protein